MQIVRPFFVWRRETNIIRVIGNDKSGSFRGSSINNTISWISVTSFGFWQLYTMGIDSQEAWVDESSLREVAVRLKIIFTKMLTSQVIPTYAVLNEFNLSSWILILKHNEQNIRYYILLGYISNNSILNPSFHTYNIKIKKLEN